MNSFLSKIAHLDAIRNVLFLSLQGELLFCTQAGMAVPIDKEAALWKVIIDGLGRPPAADLVFERGRYYLHATDLGFLVVGMVNEQSLKKIRIACANVQEKLIDPTVRKRVLLKMLSESEDDKKTHFVNALLPFADVEVAHGLMSVLQQEKTFQPKIKEKLLLSLCRTLVRCATTDALPALRKLSETYAEDAGLSGKEIAKAAMLAIRQLEVTPPGKNPTREKDEAIGAKTVDTAVGSDSAEISLSDDPEEIQINELLELGQKAQAIAFILQLITNRAKTKQFKKAEQLRDRLLQIDSMALTESIRAAEIIEEEKNASISDEFSSTWKGLLTGFSSNEFASLYHATSQRTYPDGESVVRCGDILPTLFFVNNGRLKINVLSNGREVPLKIVGPGEILGSESFFEASVWTVTIISKGASLSLLTWEKLQSDKETYQILQEKLKEFCTRFPSFSTFFTKTNRTRRQFERKKLPGQVAIDLLDQNGKDKGLAAKGELLDLSRGGVALTLRFNKKSNASALLGQKVRVGIRPDATAALLQRVGKVMAVRCFDFVGNDYSLHVEFESELSNSEIHQAVGKAW